MVIRTFLLKQTVRTGFLLLVFAVTNHSRAYKAKHIDLYTVIY